jgi:hypothetical protein
MARVDQRAGYKLINLLTQTVATIDTGEGGMQRALVGVGGSGREFFKRVKSV